MKIQLIEQSGIGAVPVKIQGSASKGIALDSMGAFKTGQKRAITASLLVLRLVSTERETAQQRNRITARFRKDLLLLSLRPLRPSCG